MALAPGEKLGPYEILDVIGKGGMGEVYRATDTRLPREVAIKTSQQKFSERFGRETKVIASLNHPNICTLFDVGPNYLVMEMIEGPTLSERIKQGALTLDETSSIMRQVADALDYAHEKGVVHRDLKPGNIKIRPDGVVKVLDFGLAKVGPSVATSADPENSPTMTLGETQAGIVLGTAAYMAPEQALGKSVDKRADVWAFGVVFYEMLTGARMHTGNSVQEIMASVLKDETDLTKIPPQAQKLIKRCLEKDPNKRLRHVGDVMVLLDDAPSSGSQPVVASPPSEHPKKKWLWPAVGVGVAIAGVALGLWAPWKKSAPLQSVTFEVGPAGKMRLIERAAMTVSPDGRWLVFPALGEDGAPRYYLRSLDGVEVRALPGTEVDQTPPAAWSYDSRWVIFAGSRGPGKLKKVDIQGGAPQELADFYGALGGADWDSDGVIIVGGGRPPIIRRVAASGGPVTPLTTPGPVQEADRWPQFLPDGKHFLYAKSSPDAAKQGVYIGSIDVPPEQQSKQRLLDIDGQAYYAPSPGGGSGYLIFVRGTTLLAQPFDPSKRTLSGEPVAVAAGVDYFPGSRHGLFTVSNTGTLVYRRGSGTQTVPTWFDQQGNASGTFGDPGEYAFPAISPDGTRVAVAKGQAGARNIWILDVARGASTRFTFDSADDSNPVWSPDGKYIVFSSNRTGQVDLYIKAADNSGEEKLLLKTEEPKTPAQWSKDGRFLLFTTSSGNILALPFPGEAKPIPLWQAQSREQASQTPRVSPDGRWLAYQSVKSGRPEIYVRPFAPNATAGAGAEYLVSKGGGARPIWRPDGKGMFYLIPGSFTAAEVDVNTVGGFQIGTPPRIFSAASTAQGQGWDLSPDGKRFLFAAPSGSGAVIPFTVVVNWVTGLNK
jgi:eukaryotic-like serine/threonine-protein kinase